MADQNRRSVGRSLRTGVAPPETSRTRVVLSRRELRRSTSDRLRCVRGPVPDGSACDQGHFHDAAFPRCRYFRAYTDPKGAAFARGWAELRTGRVRDFYVRVRNDGNTVGAFTVRGSASMRGSVVRYYSAGVEVTNAMRSAGGWHPLLAPGAMRQLRAGENRQSGHHRIPEERQPHRHMARTRTRRRQGRRPRRGAERGNGGRSGIPSPGLERPGQRVSGGELERLLAGAVATASDRKAARLSVDRVWVSPWTGETRLRGVCGRTRAGFLRQSRPLWT